MKYYQLVFFYLVPQHLRVETSLLALCRKIRSHGFFAMLCLLLAKCYQKNYAVPLSFYIIKIHVPSPLSDFLSVYFNRWSYEADFV